MRQRREIVEHPFGTMKARMEATHLLTKTFPKVAAEMALSVLAHNLTRLMNIIGGQAVDGCDHFLKHRRALATGRHPKAVLTRPRPKADIRAEQLDVDPSFEAA
jgi:hypothetical protein